MSEHLNVGDVTGPRWAGGTRNPESLSDRELQALRIRFAEYQRLYAEAEDHTGRLIERVDSLTEQLAAAEAAKADAWDEGARYVTADSTYTDLFDIPANPYRRTGDTDA